MEAKSCLHNARRCIDTAQQCDDARRRAAFFDLARVWLELGIAYDAGRLGSLLNASGVANEPLRSDQSTRP